MKRTIRHRKKDLSTNRSAPSSGAAVSSSSGRASPATASYGKHSIGYIGCSITRLATEGYAQTAGNAGRFWPGYNTDQQSIDHWANAQDPIWKAFDAQVQKYGQPGAVWVMPCVLGGNPKDDLSHALANLKTKVPSATLYLAIAELDLTNAQVCPFVPRNLTKDFMNDALASKLVLPGPTFDILTINDVGPMFNCDPNETGTRKLGKQLMEFFDRL